MDATWLRAQTVLTDLAEPLEFLARWEYANSRKHAAWPIQVAQSHGDGWYVTLEGNASGYEAVKRALASDPDAQWACEPPRGQGELVPLRDIQWEDSNQSLVVWGSDEALEPVGWGWNLIKVPLVFTRALMQRLLESRDRQVGNAALMLQTVARAPLPPAVITHDTTPDDPHLNLGQQKAVAQAMTNPVTLIWGPPGTGKTTVITALLNACRQRGETALLVSHTHQAVDEPLIRLVHTMAQSDDGWRTLGSGIVQRWGSRTSPGLRHQSVRGLPITDVIVPEDRAERVTRRERWHTVTQTALSAWGGDQNGEAWTHARQEWPYRHLWNSAGDRMEIPDRLDESIRELLIQGDVAWNADPSRDFVERGWPQIVGATITHAFLSILDWIPDVIIVDEATMSIAPALAMMALMAGSRIVFAGDFWQLPAIRPEMSQWPFESRPSAVRWISRDIFAVHDITPQDVPAHPGLVALSEQHRMHDVICRLVNEMAYGPSLRLTTHCDPLPPAWPDPAARLVLIDTAAMQGTASADQGSWINVTHQQMIVDLIALLTDADPEASIGVVTPFRPQAQQLVRQLAGYPQALAATAHRFQGSERAIMILDPVKLAGQNHPFLGNTVSARQLWNVAVSRAQRQVILVAPHTWEGSTIPARLVRYFLRHGTVIQPEAVGRLDVAAH